ncbi:unknown protein [Seminavis robusta]|uniref:Uncharacterized protein n=1 Tax=Seminavis robusta TaxID=568900 RepID=A0A9N8E3V0_9STRA|nr:unknown protein [Seminavis robusta]|eukprot:Sro590_g171880.1 n/a (129) ;mRNA; r:37900-38286
MPPSSPPPASYPKPTQEILEAVKAEQKCALLAALSALLDIVANGVLLLDRRSTMRTIWKVTLAVNLFQAGQLWGAFHRKIQKEKLHSNLPFKYHVGSHFLEMMEIMRRIWRLTTIMVTLTFCSYVVMV